MNLFVKILIGIGIFILVLFSILLINKYTLGCKNEDVLDVVSQRCYYSAPEGVINCQSGTIYSENKCYYNQVGFFSGTNLIVTLIIIGITSIGFIAYLLWKRIKTMSGLTGLMAREELDFETVVKPLFELLWAKTYIIPIKNNKPLENSFIYNDRETFSERNSGKTFIQFEVECYSCDNSAGNGVFTVILPLTLEKGENIEKLVNNWIRKRHLTYDNYKYPQSRPLGIPKTKENIMMSLLQGSETPEELLKKLQTQKEIFASFEGGEEKRELIPEPRTQPQPQPYGYSTEEIEQLEPYERVKLEDDIRKKRAFPTYKKRRF